MWLLADTNRLKIQDLFVVSEPAHRLQTAFEFTNAPGGLIFPGQNILDHVFINGTNTNGLDYGVRFSLRFGIDEGNDTSTIMNSDIFNVMRAAISIEGTQSHQHRFYAVNASGATGNGSPNCYQEPRDTLGDEIIPATNPPSYTGTVCGASFVRNELGGFTSIGGFRANFANAEYYILVTATPSTIIDNNSEGCARFLKTPAGNACFTAPVSVLGGRFATNFVASDGKFVKFQRHGSVSIKGLRVDGVYTQGTADPTIYFDPPPSCDPLQSVLEVSNLDLQIVKPHASSGYDVVQLGPSGRLIASGNVCMSGTSFLDATPANCYGITGGAYTLGNAAAKTGLVNIPNNQLISARNSGNSADIPVAKVSAADRIELGDSTHVTYVPSTTASSGGLLVGTNGNPVKQIQCGTASFAASSVPKGHASIASSTISNLPASAACTCSGGTFVASNNQTLAYENCFSTTGALNVKFMNTANSAQSTLATTVEYCCTAK
jgi:hypothetical protein